MRKIDLTGRTFGNLVVLGEAPQYVSPKGHRKSMWNCCCTCGKICTIIGSHLTTGHSFSCGCQQTAKLRPRQAEDLTGRKFGMLTVTYRQPNRMVGGNSRVVWHCRCECGNETDVLSLLLGEGLVKSCGCLSVSHAERVMAEYLAGKDIEFEAEYAPDGLYGVNGGNLKFDFMLPGVSGPAVLIELDGVQHYKPVEYFGGARKYEAVKANDASNDAWAERHGMELIRIDVSKCCSDSDFTALYDDVFTSRHMSWIDK